MNGYRAIGEGGFGTNVAIKTATRRNSQINQRKVGAHLGFGRSGQNDQMILDDVAPIHLGLIAAGGRIWLDDDPTALDLDNIEPSMREHPPNAEDVDMVSSV